MSEREAIMVARGINDQITRGRGFAPLRADRQTVRAALLECLQAWQARPDTVRCYTSQANAFLGWIEAEACDIVYWDQVTPGLLRQFASEQDVAPATMRKRWHVIQMTSKFMMENHGAEDVAVSVRPRVRKVNPFEKREVDRRKVLAGEGLREVLEAIRAKSLALHAVACLQVYAGLRVEEALALREQDIDWAGGAIRVDESAQHTPKNLYSYREIPLGQKLLTLLREQIDRLPARHPEGYVFLNRDGNPWAYRNYWGWLRPILGPLGFQPHFFRAVFVTGLCEANVNRMVLQAYVGHAPADMMGRHYEVIGMKRLREVVAAVEIA